MNKLELVKKMRKDVSGLLSGIYAIVKDTNSEHTAWIEHSFKILQKSLYELQKELEAKES